MKQLLFYLAPLVGLSASAQNTVTLEPGTSPVTPTYRYKAISPDSLNHLWMLWNGKYNRMYTATEINQLFLANNPIITGFTVTSIPTIGQVLTTGTIQETFAKLFQQSQPPTASLSGGTTLRISSASTTTVNIGYVYGKQTGTLNIASATIGGSTSGINQNANGASGSYSVNVPTNARASTSYTLIVTTVDSKTASSTTTFSVQNDRFWGRSASPTPDATIILATAGGSNQLSSSRSGTFVIGASGSNYPYFAYPSVLGALTSIKDANGLEAITSYNATIVSVTTAAGYVENYRVYTAQNATSGSTTMTTQ